MLSILKRSHVFGAVRSAIAAASLKVPSASVAIRNSCNAEVQNLRLPSLVDEDISGLQIAMNQTTLVRVMHGVANFNNDLEPLPGTEVVFFRIITQAFSANELHREVRLRT